MSNRGLHLCKAKMDCLDSVYWNDQNRITHQVGKAQTKAKDKIKRVSRRIIHRVYKLIS